MLNYQEFKETGIRLGITKLGVAKVDEIQADRLNQWLDRGYQGQMSYMERNLDKRLDPAKLLSGARSVISIYVNYHQEEPNPVLDGVISKYARSTDYHHTLKDILHDLAGELFAEQIEGLSRRQRGQLFRIFVDSAPVLEKHWATAAGIGWQGKHSNIITKEYGSWGFLGEIITTEIFNQYDLAVPDHCGTCTACIDACPTDAIEQPYQVNGSKCISYATTELAPDQDIPSEIRENMEEWIFGCDICQEVCPWNRFSKQSTNKGFLPVPAFNTGKVPVFQDLNEIEFEELFSATPLERPGLIGMRRNQKTKK
ncbi:tRNA epoxyqueuosine(34) reductase QueG [bacterium]|nr:tRNA epoxyqueuosine(34) reductase QueG [bacterium]